LLRVPWPDVDFPMTSFTTGDFNGDGKLDIAAASGGRGGTPG
jgi:hypothetical protein